MEDSAKIDALQDEIKALKLQLLNIVNKLDNSDTKPIDQVSNLTEKHTIVESQITESQSDEEIEDEEPVSTSVNTSTGNGYVFIFKCQDPNKKDNYYYYLEYSENKYRMLEKLTTKLSDLLMNKLPVKLIHFAQYQNNNDISRKLFETLYARFDGKIRYQRVKSNIGGTPMSHAKKYSIQIAKPEYAIFYKYIMALTFIERDIPKTQEEIDCSCI